MCSRVSVSDFQLVKAGDLLIEIDDQDYQARVAQAEADLLGAEAAIQNLKARKALQHAQIDQARSVIAATEADVARTRLELERQRTLLANTFGTAQKVEQAEAEEKRFEANLERNQAELHGERRQMAVLDTQESQLRAEAKAKRAALNLAKIALGYTRISAPVDGMVGERGVRVGQYVRAGTQVISVVPLNNVWVIANYKETQLTHVAVGQKAEVTIDTFPGIVSIWPCGKYCADERFAIQSVASGQCHRQLHEGRATHSGQDPAGSDKPPRWSTASRNVGDRDDRDR